MRHWNVVMAATLALAVPGALAGCAHEVMSPSDYQADESDGPAYPVSGLRLQIDSSTPEAQALVELPELAVTLGQVADGYVAPRDSVPTGSVRLAVAPYANYHASALEAIGTQIADHLTHEGFEDVIVYPLEQQIDPETGRDLRGKHYLGLTLLVRAEPKQRRGLFWK
jgi:hypothetical protein